MFVRVNINGYMKIRFSRKDSQIKIKFVPGNIANMKRNVLIILLVVCRFASPPDATAQFVNVKADYGRIEHNYQTNDSTFIYVFFASNPNTPALTATTDDGKPGHFAWYTFDDLSKTVRHFRTDSSVVQSTISVSQGGYMLGISSEGTVDTFRAWVFYDLLILNDIAVIDNNCDFLKLEASGEQPYRTNPNYFDYFDFCDLNAVQTKFIKNEFILRWEASADIRAGLPHMNDAWKTMHNACYTKIEPGPLADATYYAEMTDVFGNKSNRISSVLVPSVAAHAAFDVLAADENGSFAPTATFRGEALYRIKLNNKSVNADKFRWTGMDNQEINIKRNDTLWTYNVENVTDEIHYTPGIYPVTLAVENTGTGCKSLAHPLDAAGNKCDIVVEHSLLDSTSIPNVFTPNGDGTNDVFKFITGSEPVSMRTIDLKIYGRNGNLVYKYAGEAAGWTGWNGKFMGDKAECASGVYHYVISGTGWDNKRYAGKKFTGTVHLFRGR